MKNVQRKTLNRMINEYGELKVEVEYISAAADIINFMQEKV